jgi:trehalose-phosphatase
MTQATAHSRPAFSAVVFDLDGVVTDTARLHATAWKELFDDYLRRRARGKSFTAFDAHTDYLTYVDGKPRYEGVRSFLEARGIVLPYGDPADAPDSETVCGLGNAKDAIFERELRRHGPEVFAPTVALIHELRAGGVKIGMVTSSKHGQEILRLTGIEMLFDACVDGSVAAALGLRGKPDPEIFLKATELLAVSARASIVIEDAIPGVQAGRAGGFGLVIGVDRHGQREALAANGAHIVVADLAGITLSQLDGWFRVVVPSALDHGADIRQRLRHRRLAVFLDYDGTLTPIVERPDLAVMSAEMRATVRALAHCCTTAIISGRGLTDVARLVGLEELYYAGNHGLEIGGPDHSSIQYEPGKKFAAAVAALSQRVEDGIKSIAGVIVENKHYSLSVHYRLVAPERVGEVERVIDEALAAIPGLHKRHGKKVFELRPDIDWDKGKAVLWLLRALALDGADVVPIYIGDDTTDEDAFNALKGRGIGVLVTDTPRASAADYWLFNVAQVRQFLQLLTALACERHS